MGNNIEENIEILEKFKNNKIQRDKLERDFRCGGWKIGDIYKCFELDNAIDNILSDYKRILKENEELKNDYENLNNSVVVKNYYIKNSITVQKIKAKIEELDIAISECIYIDDDDKAYKKAVKKDKLCLLNQKRALQELLEGRE